MQTKGRSRPEGIIGYKRFPVMAFRKTDNVNPNSNRIDEHVTNCHQELCHVVSR